MRRPRIAGMGNRCRLPRFFCICTDDRNKNVFPGSLKAQKLSVMRIKENSLGWLALLLAVVFSVGFASCKDDDDDENSGGNIVGTWECEETFGREYSIDIYRFYADGTFEYEYLEGDYSSGNSRVWAESSGTYSFSDGRVTLNYQESTNVDEIGTTYSFGVRISGNEMYVEEYGDGYVFHRK